MRVDIGRQFFPWSAQRMAQKAGEIQYQLPEQADKAETVLEKTEHHAADQHDTA